MQLNVIRFSLLPSTSKPTHNIALLEINDLKTKNAFSYAFIHDICNIIHFLNNSDNICAAILTGSNGIFCSGGNIKDLLHEEGMFSGTVEEIKQKYSEGIHQIPLKLNSLTIPLIAAINGPAVGGGFDLALMCDIRIASQEAYFVSTFSKIGLVSGDGGCWFLPKVIGYSNAMYYALTADKISVNEAKHLGIISNIFLPQHLLNEALLIAEKIAEKPLSSIIATKALIRKSSSQTLEEALLISAEYQSKLHKEPEHRLAIETLMLNLKKNAL